MTGPASAILVVDDEALLARNLRRFLEGRGHEVAAAGTVEAGLAAYAAMRPDVILLDYNLPDGDGLTFIRRVRETDRQTKIAIMTAHGSVETAVAAMKAGADDFVTKPVSLEAIALLIGKLVAHSRLEGSLSYFTAREERRGGIDAIIGDSEPVLALKRRIEQLLAGEARAPSVTPPGVLILGETGTGKELVARALHFGGARRAGPFVEINCATLPHHLVESELFGHERGAFTDARERRTGLVQAADGGTLFLDEAGELPLAAQAKLLKVLEERTVRAVGSVRDRAVDVRFVAATNASLEDGVRSGEFRADLMFRLAVVTLVMPPLRARGADIAILAEHFLGDLRRRYDRPRLALSARARDALARHSWPGNVRELRNALEQAALLAVGDAIDATDLSLREPGPLGADRAANASEAPARLDEAEKGLIERALRQHRGNVTLAARELGISRDTLRYRMDRHALRRGDFA